MNTKKILVVEDDKVTQKVIGDTLRWAGYQVVTAEDAASAVRVARQEDPDLVTLDIELAMNSPGDAWDGFSVASWLRRLHDGKQKPVLVIISGSREPDKIVEQAATLGVHTCLTKPIDKQRLLDTINGALK